LLCLAGQNPTLIIGKDSTLFVVTFATSFLSAAFALSKFLKTGPCRLVPDVGRLGGFFERGFVCLLVNVALTILIKGANLTAGLQGFRNQSRAKWIGIYWILINILPQLIYALVVLLTSIGLGKTLRLITQYPGVLFISTFSLWTIAPVSKSESKSCCQLFKQEKLGISAKFTWINFILSMACSVVTSLLLDFDPGFRTDFSVMWITLAPMIITLLITLISLLHGDSLKNCCCKNCVTTKYSVLNLVTMEEDLEMQEIMNKTPNLEEQENGSYSRKDCINCSQCCMILLIVLLPLSVLFAIAYGFLFWVFEGLS